MQVHHTLVIRPHMQQKLEATHTDEIKIFLIYILVVAAVTTMHIQTASILWQS